MTSLLNQLRYLHKYTGYKYQGGLLVRGKTWNQSKYVLIEEIMESNMPN